MSEQLFAALCCGGMFIGALALAAFIDWLGSQTTDEKQPPVVDVDDETRGLDAHAKWFEDNGQKTLKTWRLKPRRERSSSRRAG